MALVLALGASAPAAARCFTDPPRAEHQTDSFEHARFVIDDADVALRIIDGAALRERLRGLPVHDALGAVLGASPFHDAAADLARLIDVGEDALFDRLLGRDFLFIIRYDDTDDEPHWAAVTVLADNDWNAFIDAAQPRLLRSRLGVPLRHLPEHELLFARRDDFVVIGPDPRSRPSLFFETAKRIVRDEGDESTLLQTPQFQRARDLPRGDIELFLRHDPPIGGWSGLTVAVRDDGCDIEHVGVYESAPWSAPPRPMHFDEDVLAEIADDCAMTIAQPFRIPFGAFLRAQIAPGTLTDAILAARGDRAIMLLGCPGDGAAAPPALVAIEMRTHREGGGQADAQVDAAALMADIDRLIIATVNHVRDTIGSQTKRPHPTMFQDAAVHEMRRLCISDVAAAALPSLTDEETMLHWRLAQCDGPASSSWLVLSTSEAAAADVCQILAAARPQQQPVDIGAQWGRVHGPAAASVVAAGVKRLRAAPDAGAEPELQRALDTLATVELLLRAAETVAWRVEVIDARHVQSTWRIDFIAPQSDTPD